MLAGFLQRKTKELDGPLLGIGLMSGTSMDAVDAALVSISPIGNSYIQTIAYIKKSIPPKLRQRLRDSMRLESSTVESICQLNFEVGELFAEAAALAAAKAEIKLADVDFIGSHGQTIYHIPRKDKSRGWTTPSTLQIGDPCIIAERTGVLTVGDFRVRDMAAGGIGAPLIPFADMFLFSDIRFDVICQNIGGIANCTLLERNGAILAFDSGPGNMVMDLIVQTMQSGKRYDKKGELARRGTVIPDLLTESLKHPFFRKKPPKATGHEDFGEQFVKWFLVIGKKRPLEDLMATACELTACSITDAYRKYIFPQANPLVVITSGGGTKNVYLMERLRALCPEVEWRTCDEYGISSDAKEAVGFAILAYATLKGIPSNIPTVTGAERPVVLGKIVPGNELLF